MNSNKNKCKYCDEEILTDFDACWKCGKEYTSELKKESSKSIEKLENQESVLLKRRIPLIWNLPFFKKIKPIYVYIFIIIGLIIDAYLNTDYQSHIGPIFSDDLTFKI